MDISGSHVLVTGASRGIGEALARGAVDGVEKGKATVRDNGRVRPALALVDVPRRVTWPFK
jgi:NAD(P)-dependent dehydrogenase (short-subunit alcohol dehydrogenase family)